MKTLLLDLETSPHKVACFGLFNQNISINRILESGRTLCGAAKWLGEPKRKRLFVSEWDDGFDAMIRRLHETISEADAVITYNGNKFDLPTLNKEFVMLGLAPPKPSQSIDLYRTVRKQFRFASNKLDYVCQQLGLGAKTQHKGIELWFGCMNGNPADQKVMQTYNVQDILLLEKLYLKLRPWVSNHPSVPLHDGDTEHHACPTCGSRNVQSRGYRYTKTAVYNQFQCNKCGKWSRSRMMSPVAGKRKELLVGG